jgi:alpha-1,3-glucosyltransferase
VAAYLSYFFGYIYKNIEPDAMKIQKGYESASLKVYMRLTVLLVDILFLFPPIVLLSQYFNKHLPQLLLVVVLLKPDAILIDHGHFQYNSLILGLILMAFYCLLTKRYYLACVLYTLTVHAKQMAVYYSLAFLAALVGLAFQDYRFNRPKILV